MGIKAKKPVQLQNYEHTSLFLSKFYPFNDEINPEIASA